MSSSVISGVTDAEVAHRVAEGRSNAVPQRAARSIGVRILGVQPQLWRSSSKATK
jgi:cation-transporting ATPase E